MDVGSTTVKLVLIKNGKITYSCYERHMSEVRKKTLELVNNLKDIIGDDKFHICISGSAGLGLAKNAEIPFVQEVFATSETVKTLAPDTDVVIELGGEDAKAIFFKGITDERMNGTCAGGTGAFIDQMASLLNVDNSTLDELSLKHQKIYSIASRCGVFAKSDIQPLINQGAKKEDIAASIYQAVVNQTISGLVQGYEISGKVMFLGGPLYYCQGLRERFVKTLKLSENNAIFPEYALVAVALGCAIFAYSNDILFSFDELVARLQKANNTHSGRGRLEPLFDNTEEYDSFVKRHSKATVKRADISKYSGEAY
ncbi:MAG: 2-hydroxyglutaryl-CoA dehydratase, partial [Clostridia bacterium]|nr:2-hydroxyglutaryl-CoA dehydratase [Clostridia bacterium]